MSKVLIIGALVALGTTQIDRPLHAQRVSPSAGGEASPDVRPMRCGGAPTQSESPRASGREQNPPARARGSASFDPDARV